MNYFCSLLWISYLSLTTDSQHLNELYVPLQVTSPLDDCISLIVDEYFEDSVSTTILTDNEDMTFIKNMNIPITIRTSFKYTTNIRAASVIILIKNLNLGDIVTSIYRSSLTKFIVVIDEDKLSDIIQFFWKHRIVFIMILVPKEDVIDIYTYHPFGVENCNQLTKPIIVNQWDKNLRTLKSPWKDVKEATFKIDMMGCFLNVSFLDFPPFVMRDRSREDVQRLHGIEGSVLEAIAEKLNFTPSYINHHENGWGTFEPQPTGLMGSIFTGESDVGLGALYPVTRRYEVMDATVTYNFDEGSALVTHVGAGRQIPRWVTIFSSEFSPILWLSTLLSFLISPIILRLLSICDKTQFCVNEFMILYSAFFGDCRENLKTWPIRLFILFWLWFSFVISAAYQSAMSSQLTAPLSPPEINTIRQLVDSNLAIAAPYAGIAIISKSIEDDETEITLKDFVNRAKAINEPINDILLRIVNYKNMSYMHHAAILRYYEIQNKEVHGNIHFLEEGLTPHFPIFFLPKFSIFTEAMSRVISNINSGGIINKWVNDIFPKYKKYDAQYVRSIKCYDIYLLFIIIVSGWFLSSISFLIEMSRSKKKGRKSDRKR